MIGFGEIVPVPFGVDRNRKDCGVGDRGDGEPVGRADCCADQAIGDVEVGGGGGILPGGAVVGPQLHVAGGNAGREGVVVTQCGGDRGCAQRSKVAMPDAGELHAVRGGRNVGSIRSQQRNRVLAGMTHAAECEAGAVDQIEMIVALVFAPGDGGGSAGDIAGRQEQASPTGEKKPLSPPGVLSILL